MNEGAEGVEGAEGAERAAIAARVAPRVCSHSFNALVRALCEDGETPVEAVRALDARVVKGAADVEHWSQCIGAVGKAAMLRALLSICRTCSTGPCTAYVIRDSYEQTVRAQRARATTTGAAEAMHAMEWKAQLARQECLAAFVEGALTSRHEAEAAEAAAVRRSRQ